MANARLSYDGTVAGVATVDNLFEENIACTSRLVV
jgi:hypothetical protein